MSIVTALPVSEISMREIMNKQHYFRENTTLLNIPMLVVAHLWYTKAAIDDSLGEINGVYSPAADLAVIHYAAGYNLPFLMDFALMSDANMDQPDKDGFTALHYAVLMGHKTMVTYLLSHGASYNVKNKNNVSPADLARIMVDKTTIHKEIMDELF